MTIKIIITDGEREAKGSIDLKSYREAQKLHGISLADEILKALLIEIEKARNSAWDDPQLSDGDMPIYRKNKL